MSNFVYSLLKNENLNINTAILILLYYSNYYVFMFVIEINY